MISFASFSRQGDEIRLLSRQLTEGKMVHALLISGETGLGKRTLATLTAAGLLCKSEGARPCCQCPDCAAVLALQHPDLTVIRKGEPIAPDVSKGRSTIPVDDIREMIRIAGEHTLEGGARVFLIQDADKMTTQAQNSLLKTLEEPPNQTYIIMTTDHAENLLSTVVSRCRAVHLKPWDDDYVMSVLLSRGIEPSRAQNAVDDAHGSIGRAAELAADEEYWHMRDEIFSIFFRNERRSDVLRISNEWKDRKGEAEKLFEILETLVRTMIRARVLESDDRRIRDYPEKWQKWMREAGYDRFTFLMDAVSRARKENESNVNFQAVLEQLQLVFIGEGNR